MKCFPDIKQLTLWSDLCVPQNENSVVPDNEKVYNAALSLETIIQKYSEKGYFCIQEVDALHRNIERKMKQIDVFFLLFLLYML